MKSNCECGDGRSDIILIPIDMKEKAFVLELKDIEKDAQKVIKRIKENRYGDELMEMGFEKIDIYGIVFCSKNCSVLYGGDLCKCSK